MDHRPSRRLFRLHSKAPTVRSHIGITLVEPNKANLVKEVSLPPWQQPVQIILGTERSSGLQVTDFWTLKMRKDIVKSFFPSKGVSKVGAIFHAQTRKENEEKIMKHWRQFTHDFNSAESKPPLSVRSVAKLPSLGYSPSHLYHQSPTHRSLFSVKRSLL